MGCGRIAIYLPSLSGGGAERVMVNLACGFTERGHKVDIILEKAEGPYLADVPQGARVFDLKTQWAIAALPGLIRYLRRECPLALLSAMGRANIVALWARSLSGVSTRVVVSCHIARTAYLQNSRQLKGRLIPYLARLFYPLADGIVAVSKGVARDQARLSGLKLDRFKVIYNPVATPDLFERARAPVEHPWFKPGQPPVIIGVGRLTMQKDFQVLIRAFSMVRRRYMARLIILGEGEDQPKLTALVHELDLGTSVLLPGFVDNPFAYMARSSLFVLSSAFEGFGNVLVEAMACGCPVVSTDCPSGPSEILDNGRYGELVPVGDVNALANAIIRSLNTPPNAQALVARAKEYNLDRTCDQYLELLLG